MHAFVIGQTLFPAICIFVATAFFSWVATQSYVTSILVSLLKSGAFLVYFSLIFDGTYTFSDDLNYMDGGEVLLSMDVGLSNILDNWGVMLAVGGGDHFFYYLYNAYAFKFFGVGYYAPVALNLIFVALMAWIGFVVFARNFESNSAVAKYFFVFLLVHPDIWTWSGMINVKDSFVLLLHVLIINSVSLLMSGRRFVAVCLLVVPIFFLLFLRFYVPVFFVVILFLYYQVIGRGWRLLVVSALIGVVSFYVVDLIVGHLLEAAFDSFLGSRSNPFVGFPRMLLTPVPFGVDDDYGFLNASALFQWIALPFALLGLFGLWRKGGVGKFLVIYFLVFISFYSLYSELQGPRHRVQLDFVWALIQFIGVRGGLLRYFASPGKYAQFRHGT